MNKQNLLAREAAKRLREGFATNPKAAAAGLLTLGYGLPPDVLFRVRWSAIDRKARLLRLGSARLPLTAQALAVLDRLLLFCAGAAPDDYLFVVSDGGVLGKALADDGVLLLTCGHISLYGLGALARTRCPNLADAEWRNKRERELAYPSDLDLARGHDAELLAVFESWHEVLNLGGLLGGKAVEVAAELRPDVEVNNGD